MYGWQKRMATVERLGVTQDAVYGTTVAAWVPLVYAVGSPSVGERFPVEIQDVLPGRSESVALGLTIATNRTRIRMRWRNDVDVSQRITIHGDTNVVYQFISGPAEVMGRKREIEFIAERFTS